MNKKYMVLAVVMMFVFAGCKAHKSPAPITGFDGGYKSNLTALDVVSYLPQQGCNEFSFDLYSKIKSEPGNIFFSPFSVYSALGMTFEGARGDTALEMQYVLHLQSDAAARRQAFLSLITAINKPDKEYQLKTSNNLWLEKTYSFEQPYLDAVTTYYGAQLAEMDFIHDFEPSRLIINAAVSEQTEGKINNLLPSGSVTTDTRLVLTNAIYFKASWKEKFDETMTYDQDFFITPENPVKVKMMHNRVNALPGDYLGKASVLEIPYKSDEVTMIILLPPAGGMQELEDNMTAGQVADWMRSRTSWQGFGPEVDLSLPKFKLETQYGMSGILQSMGIKAAFLEYAADFSGMIGWKELYISAVVHKAFVDVSEEGTEAAAATGVGMVTTTSVAPPTPVFVVDRPFIFMLVEKSTNTVLFLGRINEPKGY